jgi:hypothetical protein
VDYDQDKLIVITVVRNGSLYIRSFMEHYRRLGVAHFVFLDNGSTDATLSILTAHTNVTLLATDAPYQKYENTMKRYLAERFSLGRWHLYADIDELFDYPCSDRLPLDAFLRYLNQQGFTAVVAQMLDLFAEGPLAGVRSDPGDRLEEKYTYYDISDIDRWPYEWSVLSSSAVMVHRGGVRRRVFGTNNGLTKAALVFMDGRVEPFVDWHQVEGARVADVTCLLKHYPFVGSFGAKVEDAVRTGRYGRTTTDEYVAYARALARDPLLTLKGPFAQRFAGVEPLVAAGFLVVSDAYLQWVAEHGSRAASAGL